MLGFINTRTAMAAILENWQSKMKTRRIGQWSEKKNTGHWPILIVFIFDCQFNYLYLPHHRVKFHFSVFAQEVIHVRVWLGCCKHLFIDCCDNIPRGKVRTGLYTQFVIKNGRLGYLLLYSITYYILYII